MKIQNHQPVIRFFGNGMQITFPNKFSVIVKNGPGANCTQTKTITDAAELFLSSRFGGNYGPDVEAEVYDKKNVNVTSKFSQGDLTFLSAMQLVDLLYIVSNLK